MRSRLYALIPLTCWALVFWQKADLGRPQAILWTCHVATLLLALGMALRWRRLVEAMTLFHLIAGLPGWATDWIVGGHTTWTSVISHVLTPLSGLFVLRFQRWGWSAAGIGWALYAGMLIVARLFTEPSFNISTAFRPGRGCDRISRRCGRGGPPTSPSAR